MALQENIDQLLQARSDIDDELRRHRTKQTVLFTDIVGSTTYFDHFGDTAGLLLLYRHDSVVVGAIEEFQGIVIKTIGDSVMAQFNEPLHAVQAAVLMQQRLLHHNGSLPRSERLQIRIGINSGFGFKRANDLFGDSVNVAARITKRCGPAQILISKSVTEEIAAREIAFKSIGKVNLAGKADAEEIYEVIWTEAAAYEALRSSLAGLEKASAQRFRSIRHMMARLQRSVGAASAKTASIAVAYLLMAAVMLASRADTKRLTVPENDKDVVTSHELTAAATVEIPETNTSTPVTVVRSPAPEATPEAALPAPIPAAAPAPMTSTANRRPGWLGLIETVSIPAGTFMMGNDAGKSDEKPHHQVKLDGFNMSRTEITNRQYRAFLEATGYPRPKDPGFAKNYLMDYPDLPVVNVSYEDAIAFCAWASMKFEAAVRLPTEAEREYAALAGQVGTQFPWADQDSKTKARFKANAPRGAVATVAKGEFPANRFGLYNMSGNVGEWVSDFYSKDYYLTSPIRNPKGPAAGTKRSIRGGSWADDEQALSATRRANRSAGDHSDQVGFRIVASLLN